MKVCVTGGTGFLGAHVVRMLCERGDDVSVTYRTPGRLGAFGGLQVRPVRADVGDYAALRRAFRGAEVVFHAAGYVGSRPTDLAWRANAGGPLLAVEAAAAEGCRRVVVTSSISAIGPPSGGKPADEPTAYPEEWMGLTYPDSKHAGERVALQAGARHGIEVVVVNPGYVLGAPVDRTRPSEISARTVGNYLRGRLPAVIAAPMNFVDVDDVAAGHAEAADRGRNGERYVLGGHNSTWPALIDRVAHLSGVHHPVVVLPKATAHLAEIADTLGLPGPVSVEGYQLMSQDWRFSSAKAKRELGYRPRPLDETLRDTIDWYMELIKQGAFDGIDRSGLSTLAAGTQALSRLWLLKPVTIGQKMVDRRLITGV